MTRELLDLAAGLPEVAYDDGAVIFGEGRRQQEIVILVEGTVTITRDGTRIGVVGQPGAVLGEVGFLLDAPASATAVADGPCRCLRIDDAASFLRDRPEVTLHIARTLAQRLDLVTRYLADLQNQYGERGDSLGVVSEVLGALTQYRGDSFEPGSDRQPDAPY